MTVHFNDFDALLHTAESLHHLRNRCKALRIEWIVIDGGSDFSKHSGLLDMVTSTATVFESERDAGIYDAMNKGVRRVTGEYVNFMNAGDVFTAALSEDDVLTLLGDDGAGMIWAAAYESDRGAEEHLKPPRSRHWLWYGMPTHHQAMFFRRDFLENFKFDCRYEIAADYKLVCEIFHAPGCLTRTVGTAVCVFDLSGLSSRSYWAGLREQQDIRRSVLGIGPIRRSGIYLLKSLARVLRVSAPGAYARARYRDAST